MTRLLLLLLIGSVMSIESIDGVLQINKNNFQEAIEANPVLLIKYYVDDCNYCKKMKPVFIDLAARLSEYGIALGEVNVHDNKVFSAKQKVKAYPTLKLYKNGVAEDFPNSSDSTELLFEWALQHSYGLVNKLSTQEEIELFRKRSNIAVVSYTDADLTEIALKQLQIKFAVVNNYDLRNAAQHRVTIHNKALDAPLDFDGDISELNAFLEANAYPTAFSFNEEEFNKANNEKLPLIGIFGSKDDHLVRQFKYLAEEFKGKYRFVIVDPEQELTVRRFQFAAKTTDLIPKNTQQSLVEDIIEPNLNGLKVTIEKLTVNTPVGFQPDGTVHIVTKDNFIDYVMKSDKHVLLKVYAPWCGHCKSLAPVYEEVAKALSTQDDIVVAKVDFTEHRLEGIEIEGYPTVLLFKKGDGKVERVEYEGPRTVDGFLEFLEKQLPTPGSADDEHFPTSSALEATSDNFDELIWNSPSHVFIWFYAPYCEVCKEFNPVFEELQTAYKNNPKIQLARSDASLHSNNHIKVEAYPSLYLIIKDGPERQIIKYDSVRIVPALRAFIDQHLNIKTQEVQNNGEVIVLTVDTFKAVVQDSKQDVFVKFYAPWCGHCKQMAPALEQLAKDVANKPNVLIAKMDWTEHKVPEIVEVKGFPTLVLFKKSNGNVEQIRYKGQRTAAEMVKFIEQNQDRHDDL